MIADRNPRARLARSRVLHGLVAVGAVLAVAGCSPTLGGAGAGEEEEGRAIRIGYVSPQTGPLAAFGEADAFVDNGIEMGDGRHEVEIIVKDTQSDAKRAADVAAELILQDDVDLILVSSTPETTNPVSDQCEANGVPCISTVAPWQAYYFGRGGTPDQGFDWTYHFFWGAEDVQSVYQEIWAAAAPDATTAGQLFPNDADGNAFADPAAGFPPVLGSAGFTVTDPGTYPNGTTDFSAQISAFKSAGAEVLVGVPIPPDFTTFWKQAIQQGYQPQVATVAKALLFPSAVEALGDTGENISTEVWWSPSHPFSSSLTDQSAAELADAFTEETGSQWTQPLGFVHALFEVATAALQGTESLDDPEALRDSIASLQVDTIAGPLDWTSGPVPNVATTPLVGGQWRATADGYDLVIVANGDHPEIPTGGEPEPIDWSGR